MKANLESYTNLKETIQQDDEYAWTWHCQISVAAMARGIEHLKANMIAADAMQVLFDVNMVENPIFQKVIEMSKRTKR